MRKRSAEERSGAQKEVGFVQFETGSSADGGARESILTVQGKAVKSRRVWSQSRRSLQIADVQTRYEDVSVEPRDSSVICAESMEGQMTFQGKALKSRRVWTQCQTRCMKSQAKAAGSSVNPVPVPLYVRQTPLELPAPTVCRHCGAKKFAFESPGFCCGNGKIKPLACEWPAELKRLFTTLDEDALHFQRFAWVYNNLFAFSSLGGAMSAETEKVVANSKGKARIMVSCREFYACNLQIRVDNYLLRTCRLFQQYLVDMYVKIENTHLDFFRQNQKHIRADLYQGIVDSLGNGEVHGADIGHRVVLPPTFIGGPRDMKRRHLNAMALVQKYRKPDVFLMMTCNPKWKEIQDEFQPGERVENRPDLVVRIFHAKLMLLKKKIMEEEFFGPVAAMIYVVEFQKRGLPHLHFLIILKDGFKITTVEQYDKFVCAEIPPEDKPYLRILEKSTIWIRFHNINKFLDDIIP